MSNTRKLFSLGSIFLLIGILPLTGCDSGGSGTQITNTRPRVEITGGPLEGATDSYTAEIFWKGWDEDGVIDHFEYALDPPVDFTLDEIMDPEGTGMLITLIPGPQQGVDTLRVSKTNGAGQTVSFQWVQTPAFSREFVFETPDPDSSFQDGRQRPNRTFSGTHVVYVRAQDNELAYSEYKDLGTEGPKFRLGFNARTITPTSRIVSPNIEERDFLQVNSTITVRWDGDDSDSPDSRKKPTAYQYKLLELTALSPPVTVLTARDPNLLFLRTNEGDSCWCEIPADTSLSKTFQLGTSGHYMLGVRAKDIAGGLEPLLDFNRNVFKFQVLPTAGRPRLTVREPSVGTYDCLSTTNKGEAPVNRPLRFSWIATAEDYGGEIDGYSWGVDIPDVEQEGPNSGWSGWGPTTGNFKPIIFRTPGIHVIYVRARDKAGVITLCTIVLNVVEFSLDREMLFVDDYPDKTWPRDSEHDAFWRDRINNSGRFQPGEWGEFHAFRDNDISTAPLILSLEEMGRYKMLIWSNSAEGYNGVGLLLEQSAKQPRLGAYLSAGGKLWLTGRMTVAATTLAGNNVSADVTYPKTELGPGNFAWDFLKLQSGRINNDKGVNGNETFMMAIQADSLSNVPPIYNRMLIDELKLHPVQRARGGVTHCDAVFDPIFAESDPTFRGDIDTLYAYGAAGPIKFGRNAAFNRRLCALRWHDPAVNRAQGRIQWFGFPLYYMKDDEAQDTFNKTIDWFQEEVIGS